MKRHSAIQILFIILVLSALLIPAALYAQENSAIAVQSAEAEIVGGQIAERNEFPWQAMLFNPNGTLVCSGSLIHPHWILTAAHCLDSAGIAKVILGGFDARDGNEAERQTFMVKHSIIHPDFNASTLVNDIGLIELDGTITETASVQVIDLVTIDELNLMTPGVEAVVSGWGAEFEGGWMTNILNKVVVPMVSSEDCKTAYGALLYDGMTCAGYPEGKMDSCSGDSGGPLVVPDNMDGWKLAGVVSWGRGCARANAYGVYSNVVFFRDWYTQHISDGEGNITIPVTSEPGETGDGVQKGDSQNAHLVYLPVVTR